MSIFDKSVEIEIIGWVEDSPGVYEAWDDWEDPRQPIHHYEVSVKTTDDDRDEVISQCFQSQHDATTFADHVKDLFPLSN